MSADSVREVALPDGQKVRYESDMPMGALRGVLSAGTEGNLTTLMESMAKFVVSWEFEGDPKDSAAWDNLRRSEFNNLVTAIISDLGALGNV